MNEGIIAEPFPDTAKKYCRILYDIMLSKGVRDIILSPGSRNAPLLIGAQCRKNLNKHIILDERTAAFIALGLAMQTRRPVALACTSGTAMYNYAPAIAEAMYQSIPLVIITADRPKEWIDQDDSQTLRQFEALEKIVKASYDIPVDQNENPDIDWYVNRIINEALNTACSHTCGPVHINIQFDNPLSETIPFNPQNVRIVEQYSNTDFHNTFYDKIAETVYDKKVLITAGFMSPDHSLNKSLLGLERFGNFKILCETLANLHLPNDPYAIDRIIAPIEDSKNKTYKEILYPDIVISIGGALVSRKLKEFLRNAENCQTWTLSDTAVSIDCFKNLSSHFEVTPAVFFKGLLKALNRKSKKISNLSINNKYALNWEIIQKKIFPLQAEFLKNCEWSELKAFEYIFSHIPENYNVFLSNGTVVRYAQLFTSSLPHAIYGNRGVSGIEGTSATALGCAIGFAGTTLLITGDMSFAYNPEILAQKNVCDRLKIILINNFGGGIFRFIPSTRDVINREDLFCNRPEIPVKELCDKFGWEYIVITSEKDNIDAFYQFISCKTNALLEYKFDKEISSQQLIDFMSIKI